MKRTFLTTLVLIALFVIVVPGSVFAAAPADVTVYIRNQTAGQVNLSLTLPGEDPIFKTLETGTSSFEITEGTYEYYASTPCGNISGQWNFTTNRTLFLTCKSGAPVNSLEMDRSCVLGTFYIAYNMFESWKLWKEYDMQVAYDWDGTILTDVHSFVEWHNLNFPWVNTYAGCYDHSMPKNIPSN